jgi:uncharacterized protein (DUF885 family)
MRSIIFVCCSFFFMTSLSAQTALTDSVTLAAAMEAYGTWNPYPHGQAWRTTKGRSLKIEADELRSLRARVPDADQLSGTQRINRDLLLHVLDDNIYQREFGAHRFPLDAEGGFLTSVVYRILGQRVNSDEGFTRYQEMVQGLGDYFADQKKVMREGLKAGKTDPRLVVNNCISQIERQLATPVAESIFLQPVLDDTARTQRCQML